MTAPITIDNYDPQVIYKGNWDFGGNPLDFDGTTASTPNAGDTITLPFTGTQIGVYGKIDANSSGVITSYSIDGGSAAEWTAPPAPGTQRHLPFWTSAALPPGAHTLLVTMIHSVPNPKLWQGTVYFDYFLVTPDPATSSAAVPSTSSEAAPTSTFTPAPVTANITVSVTVSATVSVSTSSATVSVGSSAASVQNSSSAMPVARTNHIGAIAGGIVGGVAFLALMLLAVVIVQRRGRKRHIPDRIVDTKSRPASHIEDGRY